MDCSIDVSTNRLLPFRPWGRQILREALQCNLLRAGRSFLRFIGCVLDKSSLEHIIRFVAPTLAFAALDRPAKFERYTAHGFGGKCELVTRELTRPKKVIEKPAIAFLIGVARNKADHVSVIFHGDLQKFAILQKAINAGVILARSCWTLLIFILSIRILSIRLRLRACQHQSKKNERRKLRRAEAGGVDGHAHPGTFSIVATTIMRAQRDAGKPHLAVSYNLSTD